jgi:lipopolysaccharide exporter
MKILFISDHKMSNSFRNGVLSSLLLVADSFAKKLVGLASTLILARVLLPEDFGIIAIASLMIGFLSILSETGGHQYLMRVDDLDEDKVNTAWTINFIIKSVLTIVMIFSSFFIDDFYGDPRLTNIFICLSLVFFCYSLENPGTAFLRRKQNYKNIVKLTVITKVFSAIIGVVAALILKNYWALVIGQSVSALLMTIGTYAIHNHRPQFKLTNAKDQWQFSGWMIPQAMFGYSRTQLDVFIISSSFGASILGSYHTMKYIAFIPSLDIISPLSQPFLVELANSKNSTPYFTKLLKTSFILLMIVGLPISVIMFFHHSLIAAFLLGNNWLDYSYLLAAFGVLIPANIIRQQATRVLVVFGNTKQLFFIECLTFAIVYGVVLLNGVDDIKSFSFLLVSMETLVSIVFLGFIMYRYTGGKSTFDFVFSLVPLIVGGIMGKLFSDLFIFNSFHAFFQLVFITGSFVIVFLITVLTFYYLGYKRFSEWEYLESLVRRILAPIFQKLKRS